MSACDLPCRYRGEGRMKSGGGACSTLFFLECSMSGDVKQDKTRIELIRVDLLCLVETAYL